MSSILTTLILCGVSAVLLALGVFVRPLARVCGALCLVWLAAALPIMYFLNLPAMNVLLFYILSAVIGLSFNLGGKPE